METLIGLSTVRIDLATKISLMAAMIYGCSGEMSPREAVDQAATISRLADEKAKQMKINAKAQAA